MARSMYEMMGELEEKIKVVIQLVQKSQLIPVFREWKRTTDEYIKSKRDSFE
jgi:hypothetical protein